MAIEQVASVAPAGEVIGPNPSPPVCDEWVERPRPEALLAGALESRRVVVVSAMAGAGKTTLVAAVAQSLERPVAWLTVDWTHNAPGRLLKDLEAAVTMVVPRIRGVVPDALAARIPHPEAAGLLVEAMAGEGLVLVVDELERLGQGPEAWAVVEALLRHAPKDMGFVLCSSRPVPESVLPRCPHEVDRLGNAELALTVEEAAELLAALGRPAVDPAAAVEATGGWVTGVLFEAWRFREDAAGEEREDPLYDYMAAHILGSLPAADRHFLVATSVLGKITAARAAALGLHDAGARLASLRGAHIPVVWKDARRTLRCHPRFREYLQDCLESWDATRLRTLRLAHGRLLRAEGRHEDAADVLLRAGALEEAVEPAARAIFGVIDRLDFGLAQRWLDAFADVEPDGVVSPFATARLTLALATEDHRLGVDLADQLAGRGKLVELASSSSMAAVMLCQCYVMAGRYDDMLAVAAVAPDDADHRTVRAYVGVYGVDPQPPLPELTGSPSDGVLLPIVYGNGHLADVLRTTPTVGWMQAFSQPWLIAALADAGRTQEAVELYEAIRARGSANASLEAVAGPRVLTDAGRREEALEAIARGRQRAREDLSLVYELLAGVTQARLHLRLDRDPEAALAALEPVDHHPMTHRVGFLGPQVDSWYGFALLLAGRNAEALERLRRSVTAERRTGRMLDMPATAVYLAEAEWRMSNEQAAEEATDLALEAARVQGFDHMLLLALRDFPAVLSRRLAAEPAPDSPWHELAQTLHAQGVAEEVPARPPVQLQEFGRVAILVEGAEVRPRLAKSYELLAYLLTCPQHRARRGALLDVLFDGRADGSTGAYLRQAVRWLRAVLPPGAVINDRGAIVLSEDVPIVSESVQLERALAQAARRHGAERLAATLDALDVAEDQPYLPGIDSPWVEERREQLRQLGIDARYDAAELAFAEDRLQDAERLTGTVLEAEPFHEAAWRLAMRLAGARGDDQGVLRSYRRCDRILAEVGTQPSASTRKLVGQLRR